MRSKPENSRLIAIILEQYGPQSYNLRACIKTLFNVTLRLNFLLLKLRRAFEWVKEFVTRFFAHSCLGKNKEASISTKFHTVHHVMVENFLQNASFVLSRRSFFMIFSFN